MHTHTAGHVGAGPDVVRTPADIAYRRARWSLFFYPVTLLASWLISGGLFSLLDDQAGHVPFWGYLVATPPALLVGVIPGILAVLEGRKAIRLGRSDARTLVAVGVAVGVALVVADLLMFTLG